MSYEIPGFKFSQEASADLSAKQFHFLTAPDANKRTTFVGTQGAMSIGVLQNKPSAAGQAAEVMQNGISKVVAHAAVAAGAAVASSNTGRAITAATGNRVLGVAMEAAANAGEVIAVLLTGGGHTAP